MTAVHLESVYSPQFFDDKSPSTVHAAAKIVPILQGMVEAKRVIDFGCGRGEWLREYEMAGASVTGVDSSDVQEFQIHHGYFQRHAIDEPFVVIRRFDVALALEVSAHIPEDRVDIFVDNLVDAADVVVFSVEMPLQGGDAHVNEQWPSYWAHHFSERGYVVVDAIRPQIWNDHDIVVHYRQNTLLFVKMTKMYKYPSLNYWGNRTSLNMLDIVHPEKWQPMARDYFFYLDLIPTPLKRFGKWLTRHKTKPTNYKIHTR